ncbi:MAG TPA: gliding motility-associated C-terminal domain-containing protein [Bacteroidales bacterium]|nr:gliding motility-associated C-terminal domain-containing protein [Bacteroidales bacterium]
MSFLLSFAFFSTAQTIVLPTTADALIEINVSGPCLTWQTTNYGSSTIMLASVWTWNALGCGQGTIRSVVNFNLNIPADPQRLYDNRAVLNLFFPTGSTETDWYTGTATDNQFYIQRITAPWTEMAVTWDNQPATTTTGQITVPSSTPNPSTQDYHVDISTLVYDWICGSTPNYGLMLRQVGEGVTYRRVTFATKEFADPAKHPTLTLEYAEIAATAPDSICEGSNYTLSCSLNNAYNPASYQFLWTHLNTGNTYNTQNVTDPAQVPGMNTYVVQVSNPWCQTASDTVEVYVAARPNATASYNSPVCEEDTLLLTASGGLFYQWTGPNGFNSNLPNPDIAGVLTSNSGIYTATVSNGLGCDTVMTLNVTIHAKPIAAITGDTLACLGSTVLLSASGGPAYSWSTGGSSSTEPVIVTDTSTYFVTVTNTFGCSDTAKITVVTWPLPLPSVAVVNETCIGKGDGYAVATSVNGVSPYTYVWNDGHVGDTITGIVTGSYSVTVTDSNGCTGNTDVFVPGSTISCYIPQIVIPNIITPNDDGKNDMLYIKDLEYFPGSTLYIFNRWGKVIFHSDDYQNDWNGKGLAEGVYFYTLNTDNGDKFSGTLTILR